MVMEEHREFNNFEEFNDFMKQLREDSLRRERKIDRKIKHGESVFFKPVVFNLKMEVPIEFNLLLSSIIYAQINQN